MSFYFVIDSLFCCCPQVLNLIGDVKGKVAVMVDDMIDTAGEFDYIYQILMTSQKLEISDYFSPFSKRCLSIQLYLLRVNLS